jgi:hypothetical protein
MSPGAKNMSSSSVPWSGSSLFMATQARETA